MRKLILIVIVALGLLGLLAALVVNTESGQNALLKRGIKTAFASRPKAPEGLRVVVCGSASPLGNVPDRAQACIAVLTKDHFVIIDTGAGSPVRLAQASLPMGRLDGVFFTHYHSDHISALPDVNLASWVRGRKDSLKVFGPPGIDNVVNGFNQAFGQDFGYRTEHHGSDLLPPAAGPMTPVAIVPGQLAWERDGLRITSFLVEHAPVAPAVGYRIDYGSRSVVISGDTNATDTLFAAAKNADLVLHDALSRALIDPMIETTTALNVPRMPRIMTDVLDYHADSLSIEEKARAAGVKQLAYYHLVPAPPNSIAEAVFRRGMSDDTLLVKDLHQFDLPVDSEEIVITEP